MPIRKRDIVLVNISNVKTYAVKNLPHTEVKTSPTLRKHFERALTSGVARGRAAPGVTIFDAKP